MSEQKEDVTLLSKLAVSNRPWRIIKDSLIYVRPHYSEDEIVKAIQQLDILFGTTDE